jgi:hypothetical protein
MNTCDTCKHFKPHEQSPTMGDCAMTGDMNDVDWGDEKFNPTRAYGSDYEGYHASVVVGAKFGCIHWTQA